MTDKKFSLLMSTEPSPCFSKDENKQLVIDPEGAEVVKRIYREYLEGASLLQVARGLEADGILTASGRLKMETRNTEKDTTE